MENKKFVIFTDAGGDITSDLAQKFGLEMPPKSTIVWPDKVEREADYDWKEITPHDYFKLMSNKNNIFQSSVPAPQTLVDRLTEYVREDLPVLAITISSTMSGSFSTMCVAAREVEDQFQNAKIQVIDSLAYGPVITLLAIEASKYRGKGHSFEETVDYINKIKMRVHECGVLDDLFFLARKGRIGKAAAFMGNMIGIKPMAELCKETGMSLVIGKARGLKKFYKILPTYVSRTIGNYKDKTFVVSNSFREEQAAEIEKIIKDKFAPKEIVNISLSQPTGANVGPGLYSVFYVGDENVSPNCVKEKAILTDLLNLK